MKGNFLCTNVNISLLKLVLDRLADPQANCVREEQAVAAIVNCVESDVLQHFWSTMGSVVEKESIQTRSTVRQPDDMESEAVTDHAGWAIKIHLWLLISVQ